MTNRLGRRITIAFLLFGATLTLTLGLSLVTALKSTETDILDDILYAELKHFQLQVETARALGAFHSRTTIIYVTPLDEMSNIPEHLSSLTEGIHDVTHNDRNYRVLVEYIGDTRYTVQFDDTSIHAREQNFIHLVWLSMIAPMMIAFAIGWGLARRISRPIIKLANQVTALRKLPDGSLDLSEYNDDEIGILARELHHYHEQLQLLLIREKEFADNVSHELRTPVTNISLTAEVLAAKRGLSTKDHERIQRIQRAVLEMSELIETFLVLAQINNKSIKHHYTCEMGPIVRKVIEQQRVWLGDKPVKVTIEENGQLEVSAPSGILSVLVANLVRNAFRYTKQGIVTMSLTSNKLIVTDTGIGIDTPMQAKVFERYVKENSNDTNGTGLGLAIVQRICEHYGWTVSFESTKGQGSRFTVLFTP